MSRKKLLSEKEILELTNNISDLDEEMEELFIDSGSEYFQSTPDTSSDDNMRPSISKEAEKQRKRDLDRKKMKINDTERNESWTEVYVYVVDVEADSTLKDVLAPELLSSQTYEILKDKLIEHYSPKRLQIAERYKFWIAVQDFGAFLQETWRDKFVCRIRSQVIKRKLLSIDKLTFDMTYTEALSMELAEGQVRSMNIDNYVTSTSGNIDKILIKKQKKSVKSASNSKGQSHESSQKSGQKSGKLCYRCDVRRHYPEMCPAKHCECFKCKRKGHTSRVCRKDRVNSLDEQDVSDSLSSDACSVDDLVLGFLSSIQDTHNEKPVQVNLKLEGRCIKFEIDSGACRTVMHIRDYQKYYLP
ncbi:hypothetical protein NQ314_017812 [Rhamnusium bicolor]|uniref:CCHC-type domain-containing protein n=1 Tax=Rhamnusium bicolor TaxID=1586634 RepID=A0AAV8WTC8_9CUCU|nr:hypothetical protein NQ314_017812 [Rhamnusium bicolor]